MKEHVGALMRVETERVKWGKRESVKERNSSDAIKGEGHMMREADEGGTVTEGGERVKGLGGVGMSTLHGRGEEEKQER